MDRHWIKRIIKGVRNYIFVLDKIGTEVLDLARKYQNGRAPKIGAFAPFDFTEGWFRNSGLYDLCEKYQLRFMNTFIENKCQWNIDERIKEIEDSESFA